MGIFEDAERDEGEVEIEQQLDATIGEIEVEIGFRSSVKVWASLHPNGDLHVMLTNPNAKEEALGSSLYEDEIDQTFFEQADGDPLQQALARVRTLCEPEILRQKRQTEIWEAVDHFLYCGEEKPPVSRKWPLRMKWEGATRPEPFDHADADNDRPRVKVKKRPRQGPPPPDPPFQGLCTASVRLDPPDRLGVRLWYDYRVREVTETRYFKLPEDGSLTEVYEWIRALDRQAAKSAGPGA